MSNSKDTEPAPLRMERIAAILRRTRIARVRELSAELGASPASIRRDLVEMERRGQISRVHGGAMGAGHRLEESGFDDKESTAAPEKRRIAQAALSLLKPNDCVYLDGGSTILALARLLGDRPQLTVVTNSLRVAATLAGGGPKLILLGGELRRLSQTFVGPLTRPLIDRLHLDVAFMGTIGFTDREMTTTDPAEAYTKEHVMQRARRVVLLADSSKVGKVSFVSSGPLDAVDMLVTNRGIPARELRALRKRVDVMVT